MAKEIAVIDCETDPFKEGRIPQPFIWGFYTPATGVLYFNDTASLMEFLSDKDYRVYAHNGGKFDFHYMLEYIEDWSKIIMINNRLAKWQWNNIEFNDSYCILPVPLSAYAKTKVDYNIFEPEKRDLPENKKIIADYLKDDLLFTYELIDAFIQENGYSLTIASCAIKKLQKIEGIKIEDSGKAFFDDIKQFYYGGRVECFKKGIILGNIKCYDINSAYPFAMLHDHPSGNCIKDYSRAPEIVGGNFYSFRAKSKGAFPFRDNDKRLTFPNDGETRLFNCTGWEIIASMECGLYKKTDFKHIEQRIFLEKRNFKSYVDYYYTLKATSAKNSPQYIFAKLFLNSAYGKFAANPEKYKTTYLIPTDDFSYAVQEGYDIHSELHGRLIVSKPNEEEERRYYNVATGASITGFVRAYLFKALQSCENNIYCDTDSITFMGNHNLPCGNDLGQWKFEGDFNIAGIGGKKLYAMRNDKTGDEKTACKGATLSYDDIMRVAKGEIMEFNPIVPIFSIKKGKYFLKKNIAMT